MDLIYSFLSSKVLQYLWDRLPFRKVFVTPRIKKIEIKKDSQNKEVIGEEYIIFLKNNFDFPLYLVHLRIEPILVNIKVKNIIIEPLEEKQRIIRKLGKDVKTDIQHWQLTVHKKGDEQFIDFVDLLLHIVYPKSHLPYRIAVNKTNQKKNFYIKHYVAHFSKKPQPIEIFIKK